MTDALAWVALSLSGAIGSKVLRALMQHFDGDLNAALQADAVALQQVAGVGPKIAQNILAVDLPAMQKALSGWQAQGVQVIPLDDPRYPAPLQALPDPPATLFCSGQPLPDLSFAVALVGSRKASPQALDLARRLGFAVVEQGGVVVSGLALGVDTNAHLGALAAPQGRTLAVLGCGLFRLYPPANQALAHLIQRHGALISELPPETPVSNTGLVARNRIISGLCRAVIVVESSETGGAMYAAKNALKQGRQLYALDLPASGNQALLRQGALPLSPEALHWDLSNTG